MIGVNIKYHNPDQPRIAPAQGSDWIDLYVAKVWRPVTYCDGTRKLIAFALDESSPIQDMPSGWHLVANLDYLLDFGVSMQFPEMFEAYILPRSSTYKRYGLVMTNSVGVVDHTYCGDDDKWFMPCHCKQSSFLPLYARVAQFRLQWRMPTLVFNERESLPRPNRGGYGSTGR